MPKVKLRFVVCLLLLVPGFSFAGTEHDSLKIVLNKLLDAWHLNAAGAHHDAYISAMTTDGVFIGTDASENWKTAAFSAWSKPFFDRGRTWNFRALSRTISLNPESSVAWFDELLETQMGLCRGSGVIIRQAEGWKIAQYVLSATIPNELMKSVTALKSPADSAWIFRAILEKYGMKGTIIFFDPAKDKYFGCNSACWDSGYLPASTFKIANSLVGLETGVIDTGYVFKWDGQKRRLPQWDQDLTLTGAFSVSCVPCYQEVARKVGYERMASTLKKIGYPGMDVHKENIDLFWLEGSSRITPRQQVSFLRRLYSMELPLRKEVMSAVKSIMVNEVKPGFILSAKTGWAVRNGNNYGWFVGYVESRGKVWFFATMIQPADNSKIEDFTVARKQVTLEAMKVLGIID